MLNMVFFFVKNSQINVDNSSEPKYNYFGTERKELHT